MNKEYGFKVKWIKNLKSGKTDGGVVGGKTKGGGGGLCEEIEKRKIKK